MKQVIYCGAYSRQAWRGREHRQGILPKAPGEENSTADMKDRSSCSRRRKQLWATLLKKVWNIDALKCPKCSGKMNENSRNPDDEPLIDQCKPGNHSKKTAE